MFAKCDHSIKQTKPVIGKVEIQTESLHLHSTVPSTIPQRRPPKRLHALWWTSTPTALGSETSKNAEECCEEISMPAISCIKLSYDKMKPEPEDSISFSPLLPKGYHSHSLKQCILT